MDVRLLTSLPRSASVQRASQYFAQGVMVSLERSQENIRILVSSRSPPQVLLSRFRESYSTRSFCALKRLIVPALGLEDVAGNFSPQLQIYSFSLSSHHFFPFVDLHFLSFSFLHCAIPLQFLLKKPLCFAFHNEEWYEGDITIRWKHFTFHSTSIGIGLRLWSSLSVGAALVAHFHQGELVWFPQGS